MSIINKALSELDKRNTQSQYGKYEPPKSKSMLSMRAVLYSVVALLAIVLVSVSVYKFAFVEKNKSNPQPILASNEIVDNNQNVKEQQNQQQLNKEQSNNEVVVVASNNQVSPQETEVSNQKEKVVLASNVTALDNSNLTKTESIDLTKNQKVQELKPSVVKTSNLTKNNGSIKTDSRSVATTTTKEITNNSINSESSFDNDEYAQVDYDDNYNNFEVVEPKQNSYMTISKKTLSKTEQLDLYQKEAQTALVKGDMDLVISSYNKILSLQPNNNDIRAKLASFYYGNNKKMEAIKVLDRGLIVSPYHYDFRLFLARIYVSMNQKANAIKILEKATPPVKQNVDYYATLANLAREEKDYKVAEKAYLKLITLNDSDGKWYLGLALTQEQRNKKNEALVSYKKAQSLVLSKASRDFVQKRIRVLETK